MDHIDIFLKFSRNRFEAYKIMGERAISQLRDDELFAKQTYALEDEEGDNSVAIIMQHLAGNMLSRWTNFLTEDGEKEWRHRDTEFVNKEWGRDELMLFWEKGWCCLFDALDEINPSNFDTIILIRNEKYTIMEAIMRQVTHYAYHVGQIVHISKTIRGIEWTSLSIAKNRSIDFNNGMMK